MDTGAPARGGLDENGHTRDEHDALVEDVRTYFASNDDLPQTSHGQNAIIDVFRYL